LITSYDQRDITIETANYYSEICDEVIIVDEEQPYLISAALITLRKKGIKYIAYKPSGSKLSVNLTYQKRLFAANYSKNQYVVHSNHDERFTYFGLSACVTELEKEKNLTFCSGQAVAIRKDNSFTRSYKNLHEFYNVNDKINERLYYHSKRYAPIAHYSVWRRDPYIDATERTISVHNLINESGYADEVIFELAADMIGNSKAIHELYWIRNRINPPRPKHSRKMGDDALKIIRNKLHLLLQKSENISLDNIYNNLLVSLNFVRTKSFAEKGFIVIKQIIRKIIKKRKFYNIKILLANDKIIYDKKDLSNAIRSMKLAVRKN